MIKEIKDTFIYRSYEVSLLLAAMANRRKIVVNHTKIQKLLYITYGSFLAVYDKRLLDEHPESWPYGPVFPKLREDKLAEDFARIRLSDRRLSKLKSDTNLIDIIDFVLNGFGSWNMESLVAWCLDSVPCKATPDDGRIIDDYITRDFFNTLIKK